jgi:DNA modification methylase
MIQTWNTDAWDYIKSMKDKSVDAIFSDPMYDATLNMDELRRICKGHIVMFCKEGMPFFKPDKYAYWIKQPSTKNYSKNLGNFVEWIIIEKHGDVFNAGLHWSNYTGVYDDRLLEKQIHPFQKPLSLMERLIAIYSRPDDWIFDPFYGSGSTLIAANRLQRHAMGCEIDKKYQRQFREN